jgi:hypothetical protein
MTYIYRIYLNNLVPSQTSIFARLHSIESIDRYIYISIEVSLVHGMIIIVLIVYLW